jgi:energy-coupling factor transport system substrate-specific component
MQNSTSNKKMKGKDLITIGIFSAIYFVINFIFMLMGGLHPVMWILMPGFIALFTGVPFMLMAAKVQKPGAVFLMGLITGLIYFATGQFTIIILITFVIGCGLAELTRYLTSYSSFPGNSLAFAFFSLGMIGSPLPIWLFKESFLTQISEQGISSDYVSALQALSSDWMLIVLVAAPVLGALLGAFIARKLFKKHFEKAGIV